MMTPPPSDADLLVAHHSTRSPHAFATLVERHLPLIYSTALRHVRDPHLADDVTQATLILLAQKAPTIDPITLPGWLVRATRYAALNAKRAQSRRATHERQVAARPDAHYPVPANIDGTTSVAVDAALSHLSDTDRTAIVLRYLQGRSFAEIATQLHTTERAAQRRIARAIEKLRTTLTRQRVTLAPASLLTALMPHPVPPTLAANALSALSPSPHAFPSFIARGVEHAMTAIKWKATAATIAASLLFIGVAAPIAYNLGAHAPTPPPARESTRQFSHPFTGSLPPGMTVRPLATLNLTTQRWTGPDGQPLATPPFDLTSLTTRAQTPGATHILLFRITAPPTPINWTYSFPEVVSYTPATSRPDASHTQYIAAFLTPKPGATSITLTVRTATGPLTPGLTLPANATTPATITLAGISTTFSTPTSAGNRVRTSCAPPVTDQLFTDTYALDPSGNHVPFLYIDTNQTSTTYTFPSTVKEIHLDSAFYDHTIAFAPLPLR